MCFNFKATLSLVMSRILTSSTRSDVMSLQVREKKSSSLWGVDAPSKEHKECPYQEGDHGHDKIS